MSKRAFDLVAAAALAPIALVLCALASLVYWLLERESPIFAQTRTGRHQLDFTIYKLRTMKTGTDNVGTHEVAKQSVTTLGKFFRASKIDELPQLWNVLRGDMSLVGPRPGLPSQLELRTEREARNIFEVRPGITGLSQIQGLDMSDPKQLAISDKTYIEKQSMMLDLKILVKTLTGAGRGDRVRSD